MHLGKYVAAKAIPGALMLVIVPVWLRLYGAVEYGYQALTWATAAVVAALVTGWVRQSLLRYAGDPQHSLRNAPGWLWVFLLALSFFAGSGLCYAWLYGHSEHALLSWLGGLFSALLSGYLLLQAEAQRSIKSGSYALAETVRYICTVAATIVLSAASGVSLSGASQIIIGFCFGTAVACLFLVPKKGERSTTAITGSFVVKSWRYGWPLTIWLGGSMILTYIDRFFVTHGVGEVVGGEYSAVADLVVRGITISTFPLTMLAHPKIMAAYNNKAPEVALALIRRYTVLVMIVTGAVVLFASVLSGRIVNLIVENPSVSASVVPLLAAGTALWQLALMLHKPLEMEGRTKLMTAMLIGAVAVGAGVGALTLQTWSEVGPAFGYATGALTYCVLAGMAGQRVIREYV